MNVDGTVNSQTVDSVTASATLVTGLSPSQARGMLDAVLVETLGMVMYSAVSRQQGSGMMSSAATTAACAKMLSTPFPIEPAPPPPGPPPSVSPIPSPSPPPTQPATLIANSMNDAKTALATLREQLERSTANAQQARVQLDQLAKLAQSSSPAPSSPNAASETNPPTPALNAATTSSSPANTAAAEPVAAKSDKPVAPAANNSPAAPG